MFSVTGRGSDTELDGLLEMRNFQQAVGKVTSHLANWAVPSCLAAPDFVPPKNRATW
jgi:hypothetical protein